MTAISQLHKRYLMKSLIHCALVFLLLSTQVTASPTTGIKDALDELHYSLSIEWNQTDPSFLEEQKESFKKRLMLLSEQGVSNDQLMQAAVELIKDQTQRKEVELLFTRILSSQIDEQTLADSLMQLSEKMYSTGASWNARTALVSVTAIIVVATVANIVYSNIHTSRSNIKR
jgi:hypothetical protein